MIRYPLRCNASLRAELKAFAQAILDGDVMPVSGEDGLAALKLALALVASSQSQQIVALG